MRPARVVLIALLLGGACVSLDETEPPYDSGLDGIDIVSVQPAIVVPGTTLVIEGRSFVDDVLGQSTVILQGGNGKSSFEISVTPAYVDDTHLQVELGRDVIDALGGFGEISGTVRIDVMSAVDGSVHSSPNRRLALSVRKALTPTLDRLPDTALVFVNDPIALEADGLLLGGTEGRTFAIVTGCFQVGGEAGCEPVGPVEVPVSPQTPYSRQRGQFVFHPDIAGIRAGQFRGTVLLRNVHGDGLAIDSAEAGVLYDLTESVVFGLSPGTASLGQYLDVDGAGFVGAADDAATVLAIDATFSPVDGGPPVAVDTALVPEFVDGHTVRYALNEDDALADFVDLRGGGGRLVGTAHPVITFRDQQVAGPAMPIAIEIAPVRQVIHVVFTSQYVAALRQFGLRGSDGMIRSRALEVVRRDYAGINVDIRTERPTDFAAYSTVEIGGFDPNDLGLLGYDNTPGKDVGNQRLHDRLGGVNATTQQDGYPGYGGVFIQSLFTFSEHPGELADDIGAGVPAFDLIFDPLRPDAGGKPVTASDYAAGIERIERSDRCPNTADRKAQVACAVFVLGNLVGTTLSHELGHSLGLAEPASPVTIHPVTDAADRIMDAGGNRPFDERAELRGSGPARFCDDEYLYLREILPTAQPMDGSPRPTCR